MSLVVSMLSFLATASASNFYGDEPLLPRVVARGAKLSPVHVRECLPPAGLPSIFVANSVLVDYSVPWRLPHPSSCPPCSGGTQHFFEPIGPEYDISDISKVLLKILELAETWNELVVGSFSCRRERDLCIETVEGQLWRPLQEGVSAFPVPICSHRGGCSMVLLLEGGASLEEVSESRTSSLIYSGCDQIVHARSGRRHSLHSFSYLRIKTIACNGCGMRVSACFNSTSPTAASPRPPRRPLPSPLIPPSISSSELFDSHGAPIPAASSLSAPIPLRPLKEEMSKIVSSRPRPLPFSALAGSSTSLSSRVPPGAYFGRSLSSEAVRFSRRKAFLIKKSTMPTMVAKSQQIP